MFNQQSGRNPHVTSAFLLSTHALVKDLQENRIYIENVYVFSSSDSLFMFIQSPPFPPFLLSSSSLLLPPTFLPSFPNFTYMYIILETEKSSRTAPVCKSWFESERWRARSAHVWGEAGRPSSGREQICSFSSLLFYSFSLNGLADAHNGEVIFY